MWSLKVFYKEAIVYANFVMILVRKNVYKDVDLFKNVFKFIRCFESVGVIRWEELTVFGMLVCVLRLFSQNVAVSKSRHRLLFYPTRKGKKHRKILFFEMFLGSGGVDYRKGRC